ncbi:MAG: Glycerol-3-phosphate transporter, ATP-binding protein UgpC [Labilithrix sp.]|nr:Glycerol-3-phosphate transporter, ATP-binding protein UgpC [Labilithrix sp.]
MVGRRLLTEPAEVELERVEKRFEDESGRPARGPNGEALPPALAGVSVAVEKGELLVVVGPSGCGKSTTLRIVAGLEHADGGDVRIGGRSMLGVAPQDRDVAMVFQGYALYPQMTVRENIEFPLKMRKVAPAERKARADEAASLLHLARLMDRLPSELSGGERQRVAMGRAIVRRPRVFLFDEPLSNLDAALRQDLRIELGALVRELGATAIYVTHDQVEAMTLGDRICVMRAGHVLQVAAPRVIYEAPATSFVATFLGTPRMNLLDGEASADHLTCGPFTLPAAAGVRGKVVVGVRPEHLRLVDDGGGAPFTVVASEPLGAETHLLVRAGGVDLRLRAPGFDPRRPGEEVRVAIDGARVHLFEASEAGARLS